MAPSLRCWCGRHRAAIGPENLHRAKLTVEERSDQIAEWAELIKQKAKVGQLDTSAHGKGGL